MSSFAVSRIDEIDEISDGRVPWRPVRFHFGISSFGVNAFTAREPGERLINEHDEEDEQEELYLVHAGRARFEIGGETVDAPTGTFVFVERGVMRTAFAEEPGTTLIAVGGTPGQAFEAFGGEIWMPWNAAFREGRYGEVADAVRPQAEAHPEYPMVLYNLACAESLAGRPDDAVEHLRLAMERGERWREMAAEDSDFDPIRDQPAFKELVG